MAHTHSLWLGSASAPSLPPLSGDLEVDVVIVGSGITGLSTALALKQAGRRVAVVEKDAVASGVSGHTSAHLTSVPDWGFSTLEQKHGAEAARRTAGELRAAIEQIGRWARELGIDCDFQPVDGYYAALDASGDRDVEQELEACKKLEIEAHAARALPLPLAVSSAIRFPHQARFHPVRYLAGLANAVHGDGSHVLCGTAASAIVDGKPCRVETPHGAISAEAIVLATHSPLGVRVVQTEIAPYRSYCVAATIVGELGDALVWTTNDPYEYVRLVPELGSVVVGGKDHKTGHGDEREALAAIERWTREHLPVREITHRWSSQIFDPADGLPYIGRSPGSSHVWLATGFSGDGLTWGTAAGRMLSRALLGEGAALPAAFSPSRVKPLAGATHFVKENLDVAARFVGDRLRRSRVERLSELSPGEGRVVTHEGKKLALYRDPGGNLHALSAICPHMKCIVRFNALERSWDCPCHGSRFDVQGAVIDGPAISALERLTLDDAAGSE